MANILNNNFSNLKLKINKEQYIDFLLNKDESLYSISNSGLKEDCLISYIDTNDPDCLYFDDMLAKSNYFWEKCVNNGLTLKNIGYTGVDNGLILFRKDKITNEEFLKIFTESELEIEPNDCRLKLKKISGNTLDYVYPNDIIYENNIQTIRLNGGFYQGFFKTEDNKYQVLPSVINDEWAFEFVLKKENYAHPDGKILNDTYPNNKGIFFFIGTRSENKWYKYYTLKNNFNISCSSKNTYFDENYLNDSEYERNNTDIINSQWYPKEIDFIDETEHINMPDSGYYQDENYLKKYKTNSINKSLYFVDEFSTDGYIDLSHQENYFLEKEYVKNDIIIDSNFVFETNNNHKLNQQGIFEFETNNKFIFFNRTPTGFTTENFNDEKDTVVLTGITSNETSENYFVLFNRTPTGFTTENFNKETSNIKKYDIISDIDRNALAFRIDDDGRLGYRFVMKSCDNDKGYDIIEEYTLKNIIENTKWYVIDIRIKTTDNGSDLNCKENKNRKMKLYFYVNGKLKLVSKELKCINLKGLNDTIDKQEGVPYNISIGGGTQGLIEAIYPNYYDKNNEVLPIEENFAGSFIGEFKSFKFYNCPLNYYEISNNIDFEKNLLN